MSYHPAPNTPTGFSNMPGGGKFVVVLLWIRFGLGICAGLGLIVSMGTLNSLSGGADLLPSWFGAFVTFSVIQTIIWVIFYAVFAVKLPQRISSARTGTITLEILGIILSGISYALMQGTYSDLAAQGADFTSTYVGSCIGLILSIIVIAILAGQDMRDWCDR